MKELNKIIQDLKMEVETINHRSETSLEIENLGKNSGVIDASINNRIQEIEDSIDIIDSTVKENEKCKKHLAQNIQEI